MLRDTGCSGNVVVCCWLTIPWGRYHWIARITVYTPYLSGEVNVQCLPDVIYDLIIANVAGARSANDPDPNWQEACAVTTRSQAKKEGRKEGRNRFKLQVVQIVQLWIETSSWDCSAKIKPRRSIRTEEILKSKENTTMVRTAFRESLKKDIDDMITWE